ncbi:MAG: glycosyltransferase, partial [Gemmatimonadota bacterium]|nr:glycosyltransferase [Gemmatimonadota bacterium]
WEAIGLMELFGDTVMVGGRIHDGRRLLSAGLVFGFGRGCDSPDRGRHLQDPGYFAQAWKPHSVSAVSAQHAVVDPRFLAGALDTLDGLPVSLANLGPWLGASAARAGSRIVYSPFVSGRTQAAQHTETPTRETTTFRVVNDDLMPERRLLSPHLGLTPETAFLPVTEERRRHETLSNQTTPLEYEDWVTARLAARRHAYPLPARVPSLSVLTTVYSGTPAALFAKTAESVLGQTLASSFEWIVLAHGATSAELDAALTELEKEPHVRVLRLPHNLGIVGGMRHCLLAAAGEYIVPVDADDLLTPDALQVFASVIGRREAPPILVYSDEDILRAERPETPFIRPDFDPVLNLDTSYIWHLCAIRRDAALAHGLYSDPTAEYCHDWDSVNRLAVLEEPVHIPEVLYHWRHHEVSHTNRPAQHPGSIESTRTLLERRAATLPNAALFEVAEFPIFRGAVEWYIRRKRIEPPPVAVIVKSGDRASAHSPGQTLARSSFPFRSVSVLNSDADLPGTLEDLARDGLAQYVAVLSAGARPSDDEWIWEAVRLFECHPAIALCGGRVVDRHERVVRSVGVLDDRGTLVYPFVGQGRLEPGPFALALKPHLVATVPDEFYVIATDALSMEGVLDGAGDRCPALRLSAAAWAGGRAVAYSPLVEARVNDADYLRRAEDDANRDELSVSHLRRTLVGRRLGAAGFFSRQRQHWS